MAKIDKWSALLAEAKINPSMIFVEGRQFVYDSGALPAGLTGVKAGDILTVTREHGLAGSKVPGIMADWLVIKSNTGTSSTIDDRLTMAPGMVRANIGSQSAVDPKCAIPDFFRQFPIKALLDMYGYGAMRKRGATSAAWTRCGNPFLSGQLPFQNGMRRCLLDDSGNVTAYLDPDDSTKTEDGETANLSGVEDPDNPERPFGQVMVEVPDCIRYHFVADGYEYVYLSSEDFNAPEGVTKVIVPTFYYSAYEATVDATEPGRKKLASVVNLTDEFMGGDASNTQKAWTGEKDIHGRPRTSLDLATYRTYARNRGEDGDYCWNCDCYFLKNHIYWLFVTEYCTFNIQAVSAIGEGVSNWETTSWTNFNNRNPFIPCGTTNALGNASGKVTFNLKNLATFSTDVPSYRGIENPFGHIWSWTDGILTNSISATVHQLFLCDTPSLFASNIGDGYNLAGLLPTSSNFFIDNIPGHHIPMYGSVTASATTGMSDYFYAPTAGAGLRGVFFGGNAYAGTYDGLSYASASYAPSYTNPSVGSRLCYWPEAK